MKLTACYYALPSYDNYMHVEQLDNAFQDGPS